MEHALWLPAATLSSANVLKAMRALVVRTIWMTVPRSHVKIMENVSIKLTVSYVIAQIPDS